MDNLDENKQLKIFGLNVRYEREKRGLKQEDLAEILGVSSVYISNVENGKHKISLSNAIKFSKYFEKTLDYLIKEK